MTIRIELRPDEERSFWSGHDGAGHDLPGYVHQVLQTHILQAEGADKTTLTLEDLIDHEAVESCTREVEGKDVPSLEEVRDATSTIKDSMARVVIEEERAERF